jgi:EmrB/QacA subfamily drug resistance transporter
MRLPPAPDRSATHDPTSDLLIDSAGTGEIEVLPWPLLWRERMRGRVEQSDRRPWIVLVTVLLGLFGVGFTITVLTVAFRDIESDLQTTTSAATWVITGPMLMNAVLAPLWGKLADLHGARRVFLFGMGVAALFAGLCAVAWDIGGLIAFRVLGAAAGAAVGPASMVLINTSFDRERRVQAMGYWSLVAAGGPVLGVVAGGPIVEAWGWRWIFIAQAPVMAAVTVVAFLILTDTSRRSDVRFDIPGSVLIGAAVGAALLGLNRAPALGWTDPLVVGAFAVAPLLLVWWIRVERRSPAPLFPLHYLRRRNFTFPVANQFFTNFAYMGGFIITPILLADLYGYGESRIGFISIARPLTFAIAGPLAGWLAVRLGERSMGVSGSAVLVASMFVFTLVDPAHGPWLVLGALMLSGIGMGAASPAMAASVANAVEDRDLGVAGAAQQMLATLGVVAGTQVLITVQAVAADDGSALEAFHLAYLVGGLVCVGGVIAAAFVRSTPRARQLAVVPGHHADAA